MTLYHHGSRSYQEAASDAATRARAELEGIIDRGRENAAAVIHQVSTQIPRDRIAPGRMLDFVPLKEGVAISVDGEVDQIHDHAIGQISQRAKIPMAYMRHLQEQGDWGSELLSENLNRLYSMGEPGEKRYLLRSVDNGRQELRGFLSDRYRRLDSRPLLDAFAKGVTDIGCVPIEGYALDTKVMLKAVLPVVFEPVANEVVCFGLGWGNSDFGNGTNYMVEFLIRLWCTNYAISAQAMRQVHIGRRIEGDFAMSERTYDLDTRASASALNDMVAGTLMPASVEEKCALIRRAHEEEVSPTKVASYLKANLTKGEAATVTEAFSSADVVNLPPGQNKWRLSNALSWVGGQMENRERGLELMALAGKVVD